jgi:hypothetical protein
MPRPPLPLLLPALWLAWLLAAPLAEAQDTPVASGVSVQLRVGQQKVLNVGMAMGLACNDGTVVRAELRAVSPTENELVLTGLKVGKTVCRAGTANITRSKVVNITVTKQQASPPPH